MGYTLITNNDGYGEAFYSSPCGMSIRVCQVWFDIQNDQGATEDPIVQWDELAMSSPMINETMKLINEVC